MHDGENWHRSDHTPDKRRADHYLLSPARWPEVCAVIRRLAIELEENALQALMAMRSNKGAGPMLALAALREHGRLRDSAIEVGNGLVHLIKLRSTLELQAGSQASPRKLFRDPSRWV